MAKRVFLEFEHDIEAFEKKVDDLGRYALFAALICAGYAHFAVHEDFLRIRIRA